MTFHFVCGVTRTEEGNEYAGMKVPEIVGPGLKVIFVGFNPGDRSARTGHHFAGHSNLFWRLLYESGLLPVRLRAEDDRQMLRFGYGIANIVQRPSRSSADLRKEELRAGGAVLRSKVARWCPGAVCLLSKDIYRYYAGLRAGRPVEYGMQDSSVVPPSVDFVAPHPSGRAVIPYAVRLAAFKELKAFLDECRG